MEGRNKRTAYKQEFNMKAYDRIGVTVPKGCKALIEDYAKEKGESVNGLVNALLRDAMGLQEWPRQQQDNHQNT